VIVKNDKDINDKKGRVRNERWMEMREERRNRERSEGAKR